MSAQKIPLSTFCAQSDCNAALNRLAFIPFLQVFSLRNALMATCLNTAKLSGALFRLILAPSSLKETSSTQCN